jgi:NitT/TauT family transport system substrate-binding protein
MAATGRHREEKLRIRSGVLTALAGLGLAAAQAQAADTVRVGAAAQAFSFAVPEIGMDAGIFQKLGVDAQKLEFSGAAKLNQGMLAQAADVGVTGSTDFAFSVKGSPTKTVGAIVIVPVNMAISVTDKIKSVDQLKGKKFGVTQSGTLTFWLANELARVKGWGPDGIITVPVGGVLANQVASLVTGQVDAVVSDAAVGLILAEQKRGRILMTAQDYTPNLMINSIIAHNDFIKNKPDVLKRFLKGWYDSVTYLLSHKDEAVKVGMKVTGLSQETMAAEYDEQTGMWSRDGKITPEQLATLARAITDIGLVDEKPDLSKYYDSRFLPE